MDDVSWPGPYFVCFIAVYVKTLLHSDFKNLLPDESGSSVRWSDFHPFSTHILRI